MSCWSLANCQRASYFLYTLAWKKISFTKELLEEARLRLPGRRSTQIVQLEQRVTDCFQQCYASLRNQEAVTRETISHFHKRLVFTVLPMKSQEDERRRWISLAKLELLDVIDLTLLAVTAASSPVGRRASRVSPDVNAVTC